MPSSQEPPAFLLFSSAVAVVVYLRVFSPSSAGIPARVLVHRLDVQEGRQLGCGAESGDLERGGVDVRCKGDVAPAARRRDVVVGQVPADAAGCHRF